MEAGLHTIVADNIHIGWTALQHGQTEGPMKVIAGLLFSPLPGFVVGFFLMKRLAVLRHFSQRIAPLPVVTQYFSVAFLGFPTAPTMHRRPWR